MIDSQNPQIWLPELQELIFAPGPHCSLGWGAFRKVEQSELKFQFYLVLICQGSALWPGVEWAAACKSTQCHSELSSHSQMPFVGWWVRWIWWKVLYLLCGFTEEVQMTSSKVLNCVIAFKGPYWFGHFCFFGLLMEERPWRQKRGGKTQEKKITEAFLSPPLYHKTAHLYIKTACQMRGTSKGKSRSFSSIQFQR